MLTAALTAGFGEVAWLSSVDVTGVNFDQVVSIGHGEVSVYQEDGSTPKPPVGTKLNQPAQITLQSVFNADLPAAKFQEVLDSSLHSIGAAPVSYTAAGVWSFRVNHFSAYGVSIVDTEALQREEAYTAEEAAEPAQTTSLYASAELARPHAILHIKH